jgi:hypothetical protein
MTIWDARSGLAGRRARDDDGMDDAGATGITVIAAGRLERVLGTIVADK